MAIQELPKVSVVVPTRGRPKDVADLLLTILDQNYLPLEIIIIDDSQVDSTKQVADSLSSKFKFVSCKIKYVKGRGEGLTAARNLGVEISKGDAILFLDDDTLLGIDVVNSLVTFLRANPVALGVQPNILSYTDKKNDCKLVKKLENAIFKVLMLAYHYKNKLQVRRSGFSVFPNPLTKVIPVQRLYGCCCCYRREVFSELRFDANLKRWGFMEDLDFSYRIYKKSPRSLYAIPYVKVIHKGSEEGRLPTRIRIYMTTVYWFYVFFKEVFEGSLPNLISFLWASIGRLVSATGGLTIKRKPKHQWWELIYLINSYFYVFRHLREIKRRDLDFYNKQLKE